MALLPLIDKHILEQTMSAKSELEAQITKQKAGMHEIRRSLENDVRIALESKLRERLAAMIRESTAKEVEERVRHEVKCRFSYVENFTNK